MSLPTGGLGYRTDLLLRDPDGLGLLLTRRGEWANFITTRLAGKERTRRCSTSQTE